MSLSQLVINLLCVFARWQPQAKGATQINQERHTKYEKIHYANVYDQNGQHSQSKPILLWLLLLMLMLMRLLQWQPLHLLPMQIEKICQSPQMRVPQNWENWILKTEAAWQKMGTDFQPGVKCVHIFGQLLSHTSQHCNAFSPGPRPEQTWPGSAPPPTAFKCWKLVFFFSQHRVINGISEAWLYRRSWQYGDVARTLKSLYVYGQLIQVVVSLHQGEVAAPDVLIREN